MWHGRRRPARRPPGLPRRKGSQQTTGNTSSRWSASPPGTWMRRSRGRALGVPLCRARARPFLGVGGAVPGPGEAGGPLPSWPRPGPSSVPVCAVSLGEQSPAVSPPGTGAQPCPLTAPQLSSRGPKVRSSLSPLSPLPSDPRGPRERPHLHRLMRAWAPARGLLHVGCRRRPGSRDPVGRPRQQWPL